MVIHDNQLELFDLCSLASLVGMEKHFYIITHTSSSFVLKSEKGNQGNTGKTGEQNKEKKMMYQRMRSARPNQNLKDQEN